ncbi:MAG: nitrous oxide-stimulated promoter family protein [Eggerthellaceae bacterium]|nr:nitrous oxide-stimulated promoter family protein [Eggerthellaceae bacterium]
MILCMEDSPRIAARRKRKMRTVSHMIAIHCKGMGHEGRTHRLHCGECACAQCAALDAYAIKRTLRCTNIEAGVTCEECGKHCYEPDMRSQVRAAMRFAGPRMVFIHPVAAFRHLFFKE